LDRFEHRLPAQSIACWQYSWIHLLPFRAGTQCPINETLGAVCIILGLFTRFFAASIAIELAVELWIVHYAKGFGASAGGYEYVLSGASSCLPLHCGAAAPIRSTVLLAGNFNEQFA
jgi:uncharacterized membrane protein YphA (DoxX/SURF4 family)